MNRIRFDRYSVYHENAQRLGLTLFPIGSMSFVYPVGPADLDGLAYYFATEPGAGPLRYIDDIRQAIQDTPGAQAVFHAVREWRTAHGHGPEPVLEMTDRDGVLRITDTRSCARAPRHELTGLARAVYLACDAAPRPGRLAGAVASQTGLTATEEEIAGVVDTLLADRLVLAIDGRLLSLALKTPVAPLLPPDQFPGGHVYVQPLTAGVA
jgi:magnesium-protoporphyrin IX monomethyl ester (oxidative) cyclase